MSIEQIKKDLYEARTAYQAIANTAPAPEAHAASQRVKELQAVLVAKITEGAKPCPLCKKPPHGIEHQTARGFEYEVGCLGCKDVDGKPIRVRGGVLPRHAVELWNEKVP